MDWSKLPKPLVQALLPFQKDGVRFALQKDGRCLIADEMGLGKTIQAISVACMYRDEWPLLVIVPSCVKFCWIEEFEKWLPDVLPQEINLIQSGSDASGIASSPISIITYGLLRIPSAKLVQETIRRRKFQVVICDESHYLKNTKTLSSKIIVPIIKLAKRRILLSGTPALARPVELYPQLDAVCPGKFDSFWKFTERYCNPRFVRFGQMRQRKVDGASNLEELQQRMSSMLMIRREKSEVLTELPPKQRQRVLFELKDSSLKKDIIQRFDTLRQNIHKGNKNFQHLVSSMQLTTGEGLRNDQEPAQEEEDNGLSIFKDVSTLYRMSGEAKIGPVKEYIEMLCENEDLKFLVFAYHHNMMDGLQQSMYAKKVKFIRIDGSTKSVDRQAFVSQFQSDPTTRVAILSILAAGVGLTLTSAKVVVFAELYWTPGVMAQCEDRAHRIGQTDRLSVHYLVAKNTMDEWVWSSVCKKTVVTSTALSGKSRRLEHDEADPYQIDVLSKADVWTRQEVDGEDVDVSELIKSQRQPDQPSILDFFSSPRQHNTNVLTGKEGNDTINNGVKKSTIGPHLTRTRRQRIASPATKIKTANKNLADCLVILDSDEEEEFKPVRKKIKKAYCPSKVTDCVTEDEVVENHKEICESISHSVQGVDSLKESCDIGPDLSPGKDGDGKCFSDTEDLFSDKSSDSLPDVYLGPNWEKSKLKHCDSALGIENKISDEKEMPKNLVSCTESLGLTKDLDTKPYFSKQNRKRKFVQEEVISVKQTDQPIIITESKSPSEKNSLQTESKSPSIKINTFFNTSEKDSGESGNNNEICAKDNLEYLDDISLKSSVVITHNEKEPEEYLGPNIVNTPCKIKVSSSDQQIVNQWSCSVCTFLNHRDLRQCEMCDSPKKMVTKSRKHSKKSKFVKRVNDSCGLKDEVPCSSSTSLNNLNDSMTETSNCVENHTTSSEPFALPADDLTSPSSCKKSLYAERVQEAQRSCYGDSDREENSELGKEIRSNRHEMLTKDTEYCESEKSCVSDEGTENYHTFNSISSHEDQKCQFGNNVENSCEIEYSQFIDERQPKSKKCSEPESFSCIDANDDGGGHSNLKKDNIISECKEGLGIKCFQNDLINSQGSACDYNMCPSDDMCNEDFEKMEDFLLSKQHNEVKDDNANTDATTNKTTTSTKLSIPLSSSQVVSSSVSSSSMITTATTTSSLGYIVSTSDISPCHKTFKFSCSLHTGRIYIHDEKGQGLKVNFQPVDIEMGNTDRLPDFLKQPGHCRLLQRFVREWMSLSATKRRVIAKKGLVFERPLQAYESVRSVHGSTQRHLMKDTMTVEASEKADSIQGSVRLIHRPGQNGLMAENCNGKQVDGQGTAQVVTSDGVPLCLQCQKPYTNSLLPSSVISKPENAWQLRLCSRICMDKYWTLKHASYLRDQIFEIERGVCRMCNFDAQEFYNRLKSTKDIRQRADIVNKSPYRKLGSKAREKLVTQVLQGQFWHVDHIVPVWRGGGMCDLDNLRTLCTPCHTKVTKEQAGQRSNIKKLSTAVSSGDITAFFKKS